MNNIATLRNDAIYYKRLHGEVTQIRIYGLMTPTGVREVVTVPVGEPEPLTADELASLRLGKVASHIEGMKDGGYIAHSIAPIESAGKPIGAVALRTETTGYSRLLDRMNQIALLAMLLALVGITSSLYLLFRRLIYNPIGTLLASMQKAEEGELDVKVPVRSRDEIGLLCLGLNEMLARIRQMTAQLEGEQKRLEVLVSEATSELSERNRQLQEANLQLFTIQRQLVQMERLAIWRLSSLMRSARR